MDYQCRKCGKKLEDALWEASFLAGVLPDIRAGDTVDLCEKCHSEIISIIEEWWVKNNVSLKEVSHGNG